MAATGTRSAAAPAPSPPRTFRGQEEEAFPSGRSLALLAMPTPEQLGIKPPPAPLLESPVDWSGVHRRLDQLGVACFQVEKPAAGGYRVICLVPTGQPGQHRRVEGHSATRAEAVRLVLAKVEEWAAARRD